METNEAGRGGKAAMKKGMRERGEIEMLEHTQSQKGRVPFRAQNEVD